MKDRRGGRFTAYNKGYILHSQSLVWASPNAAEKRGTLHSQNRYRQCCLLRIVGN